MVNSSIWSFYSEYEFQWSRVQEDGGGTIENQPVKYNLSESGESVRHPLQPQDPYQLDCKVENDSIVLFAEVNIPPGSWEGFFPIL